MPGPEDIKARVMELFAVPPEQAGPPPSLDLYPGNSDSIGRGEANLPATLEDQYSKWEKEYSGMKWASPVGPQALFRVGLEATTEFLNRLTESEVWDELAAADTPNGSPRIDLNGRPRVAMFLQKGGAPHGVSFYETSLSPSTQPEPETLYTDNEGKYPPGTIWIAAYGDAGRSAAATAHETGGVTPLQSRPYCLDGKIPHGARSPPSYSTM